MLNHRILLTNAVANGIPSGGTWVDSQVELMSETMVYGCLIFSPANNGVTVPRNHRVDKSQLPLFALAPEYITYRPSWYWLRDVVTAAAFANVGHYGDAYYRGASSSAGVRPAFSII